MEEADELGDHICIMHQGRLRASGSSIFLKNRFGKGYLLTLAKKGKHTNVEETAKTEKSGSRTKSAMQDDLEKYVEYAMPGSEIVSSTTGVITASVSRDRPDLIARFLKALQSTDQLEWSFSNSTLEEVFLKLCAENQNVVTDAEGGDGLKTSKMCCICSIRPAETVTLYTKGGVKVTIPNFVCSRCALGEDNSEKNEVTAGASSRDTLQMGIIESFEEFSKMKGLARMNIESHGTGKDLQVRQPDLKGLEAKGSVALNQISAIILKNMQLHGKQVRTNWCFVIAIILLNVAAAIYGKFGTIGSTNLNLQPGCSNSNFYFLFPTSQFSGFCDPRAFVSLILKSSSVPISSQSGFYDFSIPFPAYLSTGQSSFSVPLTYLQGGVPTRQAITGSSRSKVCFSQKNVDADIKFESLLPPPFLNVSITDPIQFSFGASPTTPAVILPWLFYKCSEYPSIEGLASLQEQLATREAPFSPGCAQAYPFKKVGLEVAFSGISSLWTTMYPDFGMDIRRLQVSGSGINVDFDMLLYPLEPVVPSYVALYTSDRGLLAGAASFTNSGKPLTCAAIHVGPGASTTIDMIASYIESTANVVLDQIPIPAGKTVRTFSGIKGNLAPMPYIREVGEVNDSVKLLSRSFTLIFLLLASGIMFPRIIILLVQEKSENLVEMMRVQGLSLPRYWIGNYSYAFISIFGLNLIYFIIATAINSPDLAKAGFGNLFWILVVWTHGQICLSILLASLITKQVFSGMVGYLCHILSAVIAPFLLAIADGNGALPLAATIFPPIGVVSIVNVLIIGKNRSLSVGVALLSLFTSTLWGLLGCYIHAIRPSPIGISVHPLLGLQNHLSPSNKGMPKKGPAGRDEERPQSRSDRAVTDEETAVSEWSSAGHPTEPLHAITLVNLQKEFKDKVAVDGISLRIRYGETFGLLGPNGAGKTTTLSMITGLLERSGGQIYIDGKSIDDAKAQRGHRGLWKIIGVTPQFDTVWPDLSVEEHLLFYCRMHCVSNRYLTARVRKIAESIELDGDAFKTKASGLSGGMRRRLSIGISLASDPKILILDEPTTGLDPETRRTVWRIIEKLRQSDEKDRCVIITTHSMEEADALSSRIGIVCDGNLRVLGTQLYLKNTFGEGLKLSLRFKTSLALETMAKGCIISKSSFETAQTQRVSEVSQSILQALNSPLSTTFVQRIVSTDLSIAYANASIASPIEVDGSRNQSYSWMVTLEIAIPRGSVNVADVFVELDSACKRACVDDWALNETTLEEVFMRVANNWP
ncbi:hypothetical protein HDU67_002109 [Dinochytrium kinnereticum]|nr:hypothetical protein HDU67_002109 [Dinochytrium kinnereticum]